MNLARRISTSAPETPRVSVSGLSVVCEGRGSMPTSEELTELAHRVAAHGDRQAFAVLFKHFAPRVKAYLVRSGSDPRIAEELAQETMVGVWRHAARFDRDRAQVSTWIFTIARNLRIDHLRRGGAAAPIANADHLDADDAPDATPAPWSQAPVPVDEQVDALQRERLVRAALGRLSDEQARVLQLSFFDDQAHAGIAQELGIPLGTVKSRIRLAVNRLRQLLDGLEP